MDKRLTELELIMADIKEVQAKAKTRAFKERQRLSEIWKRVIRSKQ